MTLLPPPAPNAPLPAARSGRGCATTPAAQRRSWSARAHKGLAALTLCFGLLASLSLGGCDEGTTEPGGNDVSQTGSDSTGSDSAAGTDAGLELPDLFDPGTDATAGSDGTDATVSTDGTGPDPSGCDFVNANTGACGFACTSGPQDCQSGLCVDTPTGGRCTKLCSSSDCPTGWQCVAVAYVPDVRFACAPRSPKLGRPCKSKFDCISALGVSQVGALNECVPNGTDGAFCGEDCSAANATCPGGYTCKTTKSIEGGTVKQCVPDTATNVCTSYYSAIGAETGCSVGNNNGTCLGTRRCQDGALTACSAQVPAAEQCNLQDDDCDGVTDEPVPNAKCDVVSGNLKCPGVPFCQNGVSTCLGQKPSVEACDGVDNDCNGATDEGCDDDKDGYCDSAMAYVPGAGPCNKGGGDCNDLDAGKFPTAKELCNGADDNCNQLVDADDPLLLLNDPKKCENQKGVCLGASKGANLCVAGKWQQCDDATYQAWNSAYSTSDVCDDKDNDCSGVVDNGCDDDKDGYCDAGIATLGFPLTCTKGGGDCNDANNKVFPGATEQCDDVDQNCNLFVDEGCDDDADGQCDANFITVGTPKICPKGGGDCADLEPGRYLGNTELCNGKDDNCTAGIDEGFTGLGQVCGDGKGICKVVGVTVCAPDGKSAVCSTPQGQPQTEICDGLDNDCDGQSDEGCDDDDDNFCDNGMATVGTPGVCPFGGNDCNDTNDQVYPGAMEVCDSQDNDCDAKVDGADGDLLIDDPRTCESQLGACKGSRKPASLCVNGKWQPCANQQYVDWNPGYKATEQCDNIDNECDGFTDEGCDEDNDGYCNKNATVVGFAPTCENGLNDCDDNDPAVRPFQAELCDNKDNDCDGSVDEGCDDDNDNYCDASMTIPGGVIPSTCTQGGNDCDDNSSLKNPGTAETCGDFVDDNCDGVPDNGCNHYLSGVQSVGPNYLAEGYVQCFGVLDQPSLDEIPNSFDFGASNCTKGMYTKLRIACASSTLDQVRYIDLSKNILSQGVSNGTEAGLVIGANFVLPAFNVISYNPGNFQWRFVLSSSANASVGCGDLSTSLIINSTSCGAEAENCLGLPLGGASRQFLIYAGK